MSNSILTMDIPKVNAKNMTDQEFFYGHKACAGCGGSLAVRLALSTSADLRQPSAATEVV